ncbi:hypothetical protein [Nocardioides sp. T2.26MG-1]|uniref:hypothetical protein n=1 Tax=Nocardioides sp. T2.26MG-1 TaxID=3041166 RepID=UPI002477BD7E|nr:hypothetical protein [Nocardioides sp. T2.26MG-1]CAI9417284.1 hypothetical protein HIDPHFAB_02982 [Nocardioides sp. T2.26MG-1]
MNPVDYATRCAALTRRGLSLACAYDLAQTVNTVLLCELEDATDAALVQVSRLHLARQAQAEALGAAVSAATLLSVRTGPRGAPLLWDGDQA